MQYSYKTGNGRLKAITYANGDTMKASYNSIGQMIAEKWFDKDSVLKAHYKYTYDGQGNIVRSIDMLAQKEYNYEYEEGRILRATEANVVFSGEMVVGKTLVNEIRYFYDAEGTMTKKVVTSVGGAAQTIYYESTDDNTVVKFMVPDPKVDDPDHMRAVVSHSKTDSFGRKVFDELQLGTGFVSRQFQYHAGEVTQEHEDNGKLKSTPTTQLVSRITFADGRTLDYEYDAEERITKVTDSVDGITEYTYDALGQLTKEIVNGADVNVMEYDNYGNILKKNDAVYVYKPKEEGWKDLLIKVGEGDNSTITYDAQGNPTSYLGHTLTWEKGRQLKKFDSNTYTYNANGIRTSKTVAGVKHDYILDGTKILREGWNYDEETKTYQDILIPLYDNEDSVCGIIYNGEPYYFQKNLQGDVIAITNENGGVISRYSYDAWGVPSIVKDDSACSIATINPFRYRSYYFDEEIEMYYLQSRYYDPQTGRFINEDIPEILTVAHLIGEASGNNIYIYCGNNPSNGSDPTGCYNAQKEANWLIGNLYSLIMALKLSGAALATKVSGLILAVAPYLFWIVVAIAAIVVAYFVAQKALINKAHQKILETVKKTSKTRYWTATIQKDYVDIGRGLRFSQAVKEVYEGRNVFTVTSAEAMAVAKSASNGKKPVGPEIDKGKENTNGFYRHYHKYDRKGHVFFLFL